MPQLRPPVHDLLASVFAELAGLPEPHLRALMPVLAQAEAELARDLASWLRTVTDAEATFTAQRLRVALVQIRGSLRRLRGTSDALFDVLAEGGREAGSMALGHMARQAQRFSGLFSGSLRALPLPSAATLAHGESLLLRRFERSAKTYGEWAVGQVQNQLAVGVARGETFHEMTKRLQRLSPTARNVAGMVEGPTAVAQDIARGVGERLRNRAELIVRTEVVSAYNGTALAAIKSAADEDEDYVARWDSTLDKRGCELCRRLHDTRRAPGKEFPGGVKCPPRHPRCRCALTYWHKDWDEPTAGGVADQVDDGDTGMPAVHVLPERPVKPAAAPPSVPPAPPPPAGGGGAGGGSGGGGGRKGSRGLAAVEAEKLRPMATTMPDNVVIPKHITRAHLDDLEDAVEGVLGKRVPVEELFHGFNTGPGTRMELREILMDDGRVAIKWDVFDAATGARMTDDEGLMRSFHVTDHGPTVHHDYFVLEKAFQGDGVAKVLNGNAMLRYEKWGVAAIDLDAAWVGRHAWASMGFNFASPEDVLQDFASFIARVGRKWSPAKRAEAMGLARSMVDRPWEFCRMDLDGMSFPDEFNKPPRGVFRLGQAFLLSRECEVWEGVMALSPDNPGYLHALEMLRVWERG